LSKIDIVVDKKSLEKPKDTMALIMKLETNDILNDMLFLTFNQWYIYPLVNILQLLYFFGLSFALILFNSYLLPIPHVGGGIEKMAQISNVVKQS